MFKNIKDNKITSDHQPACSCVMSEGLLWDRAHKAPAQMRHRPDVTSDLCSLSLLGTQGNNGNSCWSKTEIKGALDPGSAL